VGGGIPIRHEAPEKKFLVVPLHLLALKVQLVVLVSAFVMVSIMHGLQFGHFLVCCSFTHGAPVRHGVGASSQVYTKDHQQSREPR